MAARTTKAVPTYTHVGHKPNVAYVHTSSRLYGHSDVIPGKYHAMTCGERGYYVACCGERIADRYDDGYHDPITTHIQPATDATGSGVTCARCRKLLKVQRYAVQYVSYGRWFTLKDAKFATKGEAEAKMADVRTTYPGVAVRIRLV